MPSTPTKAMADLESATTGPPGLYLVSSPDENTDERDIIDIVLVHGLNGHCIETWANTQGRTHFVWIRDLLPNAMPYARIMTYKYDARVIGNATVDRMLTTGRHLLRELVDCRENLENRPIVFLAHSLGGIVVKKALRVANDDKSDGAKDGGVATQTRGIVFFGTPHRGSDAADLLGPILNALAPVYFWNRSKYVDLLKSHSGGLLDVSREFRPFASKYALISFYELNVHPVSGKVVVDEHTALMGFAHEEGIPLAGTHSTMCKFTNNDPRFKTVWKAIERAAAGPPQLRKA